MRNFFTPNFQLSKLRNYLRNFNIFQLSYLLILPILKYSQLFENFQKFFLPNFQTAPTITQFRNFYDFKTCTSFFRYLDRIFNSKTRIPRISRSFIPYLEFLCRINNLDRMYDFNNAFFCIAKTSNSNTNS